MVELSNTILIERDGTLYRSSIEGLTPIILSISEKERFIDYLNTLSASLEKLTASFDVILYSNSEMKSDFAIKESVSDLSASGNYTQASQAQAAINGIKNKTDLKKDNDKYCWYETQLGMTVKKCLITAYEQSSGIVTADPNGHKAEEWMIAPSYEILMGMIETGDM